MRPGWPRGKAGRAVSLLADARPYEPPFPAPTLDLAPLQISRSSRAGQRRFRALRWLLALAALAVIVFLLSGPLGGALSRWKSPEVQVAVVEAQSPLAFTALRGTAANGYVVAARRAALSADAPGRIVEMRVTEGSRVEAGDLVARLYQDELRAALAGAEARIATARAEAARAAAEVEASVAELPSLEAAIQGAAAEIQAADARLGLAKYDLERQSMLAESGVATDRARTGARTEFDSAEAARAVAEAQLASARAGLAAQRARIVAVEAAANVAAAGVDSAIVDRDLAKASLDKTEVRAPFAGLVVLKDAEVGEVVSPNVQGGANARGAICTLVDMDSLEVQVEVPETSLSKIVQGGPARIFLDAYPEVPYAGRVARVWPTANRQKGTVEVRVAFEKRDDRLRPELGLRVVFLSEADLEDEAALAPSGPVLLIAPEYVLERGGRRGVQVVEDGALRFQALELGPLRFGRLQVLEGLEPGAKVLVKPDGALTDGTAVRVAGP